MGTRQCRLGQRAPLGGQHTGPNPIDCSKLGYKHHLLVNQRGLPLVPSISGAQVHDSRLLIALLDAVPSVSGLTGRPCKYPAKLHADKAYASRTHRACLRSRTTHCPLRHRVTRAPGQMALGG